MKTNQIEHKLELEVPLEKVKGFLKTLGIEIEGNIKSLEITYNKRWDTEATIKIEAIKEDRLKAIEHKKS